MGIRHRQILCLALLAGGSALWFATYCHGELGFRFEALAWAIGLGLVWPLNRWCFGKAEQCGEFLSRHRMAASVGAGIFAAVSSLIYIHGRGAGLCLRMHDDHVFMIQAQMLAKGRLWMPAYPPDISPFFDSFHLFAQPIYAGMYCPGTALMLTPGVWLHWPFWAMPVVTSSVAAGVLFFILEEMFGSVRAVLGVIMMALGYWFRYLSTAALSELPMFLGILALCWGWMRWRKQQGMGWAVLMGAAAGYCAITRPLDALCFCPVIGAAIILEFRRRGGLLTKTFATIVMAAAPFLVLLVIQNIGLSGKWYVLGEEALLRHVYPASPVGFFHLDFSRLPANPGIEKRAWLAQFVIPAYESHTPANVLRWLFPDFFQYLITVTLPHSALVILATAGILSLKGIRRAAFGVFMLTFLPAYACVVFFLVQYLFPLLASMTCLVFMGWESLESVWPNRRMAVGGFLLVCILVLSVADLPAFNPEIRSGAIDFHDREQRMANEALSNLPKTPALVLFRFDPSTCDPHDEPVYNDSVAWPDDAPIVRARDLGRAEDWKLIEYYARRQPGRWIYTYDRGAALQSRNPLSQPLGTAGELAATLGR
jgi:hypothetical protein